MNPVTGVVAYLIIWWMVFLAALPFGVRGQWEQGNVIPGSEPGAPVRPLILKKMLWTSVITAGIWLVVYLVLTFGGFSIYDLPGPDSYWD